MICNTCKIDKNLNEFIKDKYIKGGYKLQCKICIKNRKFKIKLIAKPGFKICSKCNIEKELSFFFNDRYQKDRKTCQCKKCYSDYVQNIPPEQKLESYRINNRREKIKIYQRNRNIKSHGITPDKYEELLIKQNHQCKICKTPTPTGMGGRFQIDHNHQCCSGTKSCGKCIRGLLCYKCNAGLGYLQDNPHFLLKGAFYIINNGNLKDMDTVPDEIGFIVKTFNNIKDIERTKYRKAQVLRKQIMLKLELGEEIENYRIDFLRQSVDKLFTFMEEIGKEFNGQHPDDKFTTNDIGDILASAIQVINNNENIS